MKILNYSVVIPVYNSEGTLKELVQRIQAVFEALESSFELIFVDDASHDQSWTILTEIQQNYSNVKIIRLSRNFGQHNALLCGFRYAQGEYLITLDDDLQNPPEEIPQLINAIQKSDLDVVIAVAREKKQALLRGWGSWLVSGLTAKIFGMGKDLRIGSFRIMTKDVYRELCKMNTRNAAVDAMIFSFVHSSRVKNIFVKHESRKLGRSQYNLYKLFNLAFNNILNYSTLPLKVMSAIGTVVAFVGFIAAFILIIKYFIAGVPVQGWTSIIVTLFFFFGLILFCLGIIGEYLVRIIREVNHSNAFVVREERLYDTDG